MAAIVTPTGTAGADDRTTGEDVASSAPTSGIEPTAVGEVAEIVDRARSAARSLLGESARRSVLEKLRRLLVDKESMLLAALAADLGKPRAEAWVTEIGFTLADIDHTLAHLHSWMQPERVATPVAFQPGSSRIEYQPLGVVAIISPWNYPVQLLLAPAVAAIAAGNAVVLKPSELTPTVDAAMADLVAALDEPTVAIVHGGVSQTTELLEQRFDHIMYTGNGKVARIVSAAAAKNLTPVTLELGGKSPAIVSAQANLDIAGRRIAWGKFLNAGQTCIAPDYVLVERSVRDRLVESIRRAIKEFYGDEPAVSPDFARIVTHHHFDRLAPLIESGTVAIGGAIDRDTKMIEPTVLVDVELDSPVMGQEIFGPILPVIAVDSIDQATEIVNAGDKPLALYTFSDIEAENDKVLAATSSGGACVNGTLFHVSNPHLPFGGVGESGQGAYHGKWGFETFSHRRAVHTRSTRMDPALLYPPYTEQREKIIRKGFLMPDPRDMVAKLWSKVRSGSST